MIVDAPTSSIDLLPDPNSETVTVYSMFVLNTRLQYLCRDVIFSCLSAEQSRNGLPVVTCCLLRCCVYLLSFLYLE